jgi:hypothetical protein
VNSNANRQTRFPGGTEIQKISITEADKQDVKIPMKIEEAVRAPSPIPLRINPPDGPSVRAQPTMSVATIQRDQSPFVKIESPWSRYTSLRSLERGGSIIAACTIQAPVQMVAVKQVSSYNFEKLGTSQHENLLAIMEVYRFQGAFFIITDYTAATLRQVIAIPLQLEEIHVSATCRQGSPLVRLARFSC